MKYFNFVNISLFTILVISCTTIHFHPGKYVDKNGFYSFLINEDSTFCFQDQSSCYSESSGYWKIVSDSLILNSYTQIHKVAITCDITRGNNSIIVVNVEIHAEDDLEKDYICSPYINNTRAFMYPEKGSYSFKSKVPIDSIYFILDKKPSLLRGLGVYGCYNEIESEVLAPHASMGDILTIHVTIVDSLFGYTVFRDQLLKLKKHKILFPQNRQKYELRLP